ncbi:hypothetical protein [Desulfallas thermosapovorans]|uniref:Uncharacterized protein n=1 Tax=Desulfallas thermosapovorans DSM 6562 TaxID=1121431 RepID=A0A5S4ZP74_9FIRM|nr:hypothetical protein [Desulfallas thermosapovorans]TYO93860.1 hypothetical protein LX24_02540 [Desulfallas thermosapovorans DSM 6562]
MTEKKHKMPQPVRITMAIVLWGLILWVLTFNSPPLVPVARAIFIVFVIPSGLGEWLKYKGLVDESKAMVLKLVLMIVAAVAWYFFYR